MLGNDAAGDCVAVTWANQRALVTTALARSTSYPTQDEVWTFYRTQNPNFDPTGTKDTNGPGSSADNGMDIQTALEYLVHNAGPDGAKAIAFAYPFMAKALEDLAETYAREAVMHDTDASIRRRLSH